MQQLFELLVDVWETGNWWARIAIISLLAYPILVVALACCGVGLPISIVGVSFFVVLITSVIAGIDPLVVGVISAFSQGRSFLKWLFTILGAEALMGIWFSVIKPYNIYLTSIEVLVLMGFLALSLVVPSTVEQTATRLRKIILAIGTVLMVFLIFASIFPKSISKLDGVRDRVDRGVAGFMDTTEVVRKEPLRSSILAPEPVFLEPGKAMSDISVNNGVTTPPEFAGKKDLYFRSVTLEEPSVWSEEIDLYNLVPFRNKFSTVAHDSARIKFRDGAEFTIFPGSSVKFGSRQPVVRLMAYHSNTRVDLGIWNKD